MFYPDSEAIQRRIKIKPSNKSCLSSRQESTLRELTQPGLLMNADNQFSYILHVANLM